ncbi:MAG TPA: Spy/CpxP family protein refolding chaperone [Acidobacteriaceae bacterium]|nr:Spy/CpxP family protein refolding chaperone [Acidobacteriaceae bacterium]
MKRSKAFIVAALAGVLSCGLVLAQGPDGPGPGGRDRGGPGGPGFGGPAPMDHMFHDGHFGRWWNDPQLAQQIGLTDQQKQQMDQIFLQHRLKLIDLNANLEKQEVMFRPMIEADQPDETKILAQIDAIAQARADLEKADARMLFDLRKTLTPEQWTKLKAMRMQHRDRDRMRNDRRDSWGPGRHGPMGPNGGPPAGPPNGAPQGQAPAPPQ